MREVTAADLLPFSPDYDPLVIVKPYDFGDRYDSSGKPVIKCDMTTERFVAFWAQERQAFDWRLAPEGGSSGFIKNATEDKDALVPNPKPVTTRFPPNSGFSATGRRGRPKLFAWSMRYVCARSKKPPKYKRMGPDKEGEDTGIEGEDPSSAGDDLNKEARGLSKPGEAPGNDDETLSKEGRGGRKKRDREYLPCGCKAFLRAQKLLNKDIVSITYHWHHNHPTTTRSNAKLPVTANNRCWIDRQVASGRDWKAIRAILHPTPEQKTLIEEGKIEAPPGLNIKYSDVHGTLYRRAKSSGNSGTGRQKSSHPNGVQPTADQVQNQLHLLSSVADLQAKGDETVREQGDPLDQV
ncbi:hypothetical protein BC939DRAFT_501686 [Gamsiella multidivaricata]|uniref:uncharacterized protein n=1 Tax=Gamsiella multidivaricata TaxID=101098 RepID=UPI00221E5B50|nr:uncharacterized protein BC939DRAFT_501686 [Gamsiella multidivaricata]KAG0365406.1 hypothetical protein BGZ54_006551 [Gamsiella multidivaricata]KAI7826501.1 hypothetical protein BC939DRAFT_501686 [Gamsiella multidivaricata]